MRKREKKRKWPSYIPRHTVRIQGTKLLKFVCRHELGHIHENTYSLFSKGAHWNPTTKSNQSLTYTQAVPDGQSSSTIQKGWIDLNQGCLTRRTSPSLKCKVSLHNLMPCFSLTMPPHWRGKLEDALTRFKNASPNAVTLGIVIKARGCSLFCLMDPVYISPPRTVELHGPVCRWLHLNNWESEDFLSPIITMLPQFFHQYACKSSPATT
jgi:hypothetical protein